MSRVTSSVRAAATRVAARPLVVVLVAAAVAAVPVCAELAGMGRRRTLAWFIGVVALSVGSLVLAAVRSRGRLRLAWALLGACLSIMSSLQVSPVLAGPAVDGRGLRILALVMAAAAFGALVRVGYAARGWLLLGLDGWLLGASLFTGLWLVAITPARLAAAPPLFAVQCVWVLFDLALASVLVALTHRLPRGERGGGAVIAGVAALIGVGNLALAFAPTTGWTTGGRAVFLGAWTASLLLAGSAPWVSRDPFAALGGSRVPGGPLRVPSAVASVSAAATVLVWAAGRSVDPLLAVVVVTLLLCLLASQTLLAVENARLVAQVSHQADTFRERATRDVLTGLPNRAEFTSRLESALAGAASGRVAVLFLDLDGFKDVNDSFGHEAGDVLLVEASDRLGQHVRGTDVVGRFGGDEFVALLADCSETDAQEVAERLRAALSEPYRIGLREVVVSASIGLSRPGPDDDAESALRNADLALYRAKQAGRDRVTVYEPTMHASVLRRLDSAARLRQALAHDALALAYQPIIDLRTGAVLAMEALLRFDDPELGSVLEVVETAEESGLIVPLGGWVLDAAVGMLAGWRADGHDVRVSVNVSARQLESGQFVRQVQNTLLYHDVPASALQLELTEHQLMRDLEASSRELGRLRALGVGLALDDFGTGYSSLAHLQVLPLDAMKIDRSLVSRVGGARDTVPGVLRLGQDLALAVVAEGVESLEQHVLLRASGCTMAQGYLYSPPLAPQVATEVVARGRVDLPGDAVSQGRTFVSDPEIGRVIA